MYFTKERNVLVLDDHPTVLLGVERMLNSLGLLLNVTTMQKLTQKYMLDIEHGAFDLIIVDYRLKTQNGAEICRQAKAVNPEIRSILFTGYLDRNLFYEIYRGGIDCFVSKDSNASMFSKALLAIDKGCTFVDDTIGEPYRKQYQLIELLHKASKRELEVIPLILEGFSNVEISKKLFVSAKTVETHKKNLKRKFNLTSNRDLMLFLARNSELIALMIKASD